nr:hypothetical protein [uncultured Draconibacterium sp.]
MIRELMNFVNDLEQDYPEVFDLNKTPSPGRHLWVDWMRMETIITLVEINTLIPK